MKTFVKSNRWLLTIILISVISRSVAAIFFGNQVVDLPGTYDQISYNTLANRVLHGYGFSFGQTWWPITPAGAPTAHWSFLYTLYLVAVYFIFGSNPLAARLIQAIITGILQPYLAYLIGNRLFSNIVGLISAGLTACYAYFIYYDATLMTEPFFITIVMATLYISILLAASIGKMAKLSSAWDNVRLPIIFGLVLGGAILLRQLFLLLIPFLYLWIAWIGRKETIRKVALKLFISIMIIALMILPFTLYNYLRFGHFVLLNTNSGYAFFWSNNPIYGTHFVPILSPQMGDYASLIPIELRNLDEAALDQALMVRGVQFIINDPLRYILLSISKIPVYFMFWPSADSGLVSNISRVASFGVLWPFMFYGLWRAFRERKLKIEDYLDSPKILLVIFIIIYSLIHLLSWALIRYRLPVDAILIVFAGVGLVDITQRIMALLKLPYRIA